MPSYELSDYVQTETGAFTTLLITFGQMTAVECAQVIARQNNEVIHVWHRVAITLVHLYATVQADGSVTYQDRNWSN